MTIGEAGFDQRTPNMAAIVQEIVDRDGWSSGNAVVIMISGTGVGTAALTGTATLISGTTYQYAFTGDFVDGDVTVEISFDGPRDVQMVILQEE